MVNTRKAEVASKADPDAQVKDVRMKIESESDGENGAGNNTPDDSMEVMRAAWKKLDVPWKNDKSRDYPGYEGGSGEDVLSIIGCGKSSHSFSGVDWLAISNARE